MVRQGGKSHTTPLHSTPLYKASCDLFHCNKGKKQRENSAKILDLLCDSSHLNQHKQYSFIIIISL